MLANLANFAYDPSNYEYLRQLQVLDLFLDMLTEDNETLVEFAMGKGCPSTLSRDPGRAHRAPRSVWSLIRPEFTRDSKNKQQTHTVLIKPHLVQNGREAGMTLHVLTELNEDTIWKGFWWGFFPEHYLINILLKSLLQSLIHRFCQVHCTDPCNHFAIGNVEYLLDIF